MTQQLPNWIECPKCHLVIEDGKATHSDNCPNRNATYDVATSTWVKPKKVKP